MDTDTVNFESTDDVALADKMNEGRRQIVAELRKRIVGQDEVVDLVLLTLFVGGNSLIVGVPGLAKTLLIATLAKVVDLKFNRIQFTPDLMPSDITGTDIINEDATTGRRQMVFATQNPIEQEGTYPLPEAQLDRFMFHIIIDHPPENEEFEVVRTTTALQDPQFARPVNGEDLVAFQRLVRRVPVAEAVMRYALNIVRTSRPKSKQAPDSVKKWVAFGASVRAAQYLVLGAKARALTSGRYHVNFDDIRALAHPVLRHRVLTNFRAESEGVTTDSIIDELLSAVPVPKSGM